MKQKSKLEEIFPFLMKGDFIAADKILSAGGALVAGITLFIKTKTWINKC